MSDFFKGAEQFNAEGATVPFYKRAGGDQICKPKHQNRDGKSQIPRRTDP